MINDREGKHYGVCESCNLEWELTDKDLIDCWNPTKCAAIAINFFGLSEKDAEEPHKHLAYPFFLCEICRSESVHLPRVCEVELA